MRNSTLWEKGKVVPLITSPGALGSASKGTTAAATTYTAAAEGGRGGVVVLQRLSGLVGVWVCACVRMTILCCLLLQLLLVFRRP